MIRGIGTDIIEIDRIEKAIEKNNRFIERVFSEREIDVLKKNGFRVESIAGRFAVKEAVSKALGTGFRGFSFLDIEIISNELGKPEVLLSEKIRALFQLDNTSIHVSISHNKNNAIAFVLIEE